MESPTGGKGGKQGFNRSRIDVIESEWGAMGGPTPCKGPQRVVDTPLCVSDTSSTNNGSTAHAMVSDGLLIPTLTTFHAHTQAFHPTPNKCSSSTNSTTSIRNSRRRPP